MEYICVYDGSVHDSIEARKVYKKKNKYHKKPYDVDVVKNIIKDYLKAEDDLHKKYGIDKNSIKKIIIKSGNKWRTMEETFLLKYGVPYASQLDVVKSKVSNTLTSKSDEEKLAIELKKQATCLSNHGVTHAHKNKNICDKMRVTQKETMMKKYGVDHPCKVKEIQERSELTRQKKQW